MNARRRSATSFSPSERARTSAWSVSADSNPRTRAARVSRNFKIGDSLPGASFRRLGGLSVVPGGGLWVRKPDESPPHPRVSAPERDLAGVRRQTPSDTTVGRLATGTGPRSLGRKAQLWASPPDSVDSLPL